MGVNYDGRVFRSSAAETADATGSGPVGHYHQKDDLVWAEFAGGKVVHGSLVGRCADDGVLDLVYCQRLHDGSLVTGRCRSTPEVLPDGRIRLREDWERLGPHAATGVSYIVEVSP